MVAEWIDHAAQAPAIGLFYRDDRLGTGSKGLGEGRIRVRHGQNHPNSTAAQRLRAEVAMLRGLVAQPELRTIDGQPRHHCTAVLDTIDFERPERRLVELNRSGA